MPSEMPTITGALVVPRLRIQNANAISSPLTWGAPAGHHAEPRAQAGR